MKIHIGSNIIFRVSEQYYALYNFLTIDFGENLQEYFFVQNQFLIIKKLAQPVQEAGIDHFHFPKSFTIDLR